FGDYFIPSKAIVQGQRIKREFVYNFEVMSGKFEDSTLQAIIDFDAAGGIQHKTEFRDSSLVMSSKSYQYDDSGRIFCMNENVEWPKAVQLKQQFFYDSAGMEDVNYTINEDTTYIRVEKMVYDEKRRPVGSVVKFGKGEWLPCAHYTYDAGGDMQEERFYNIKGEFEYANVYTYDHAARTRTTFRQEGKKKPLFMGIHFYDSLNRCIKYVNEPENASTISRTLGYDRVDYWPRLDKYVYDPGGPLYEFRRSDKGRVSQLIRYYYTKR
ncbi:MAG: hypothetical protein Q8938_15645, partial [Bacteroidota bacterium]|nr:hypothetical protein [Bacteroidota bacterium]